MMALSETVLCRLSALRAFLDPTGAGDAVPRLLELMEAAAGDLQRASGPEEAADLLLRHALQRWEVPLEPGH